MKAQKINLKAVLAAAGAGMGYNFAIEGAAKKVEFINQNYLVTKSLTAGLLGSGMLYFGKTETSKAAGYALLGVAGASGATKLASVIVSDAPAMQGIVKRARKRGILSASRGAGKPARRFAPKIAGNLFDVARAKRSEMQAMKTRPNSTQACTPFGQLALNELYN